MKHIWNKTQIKALRSSILHWERMKLNKRRNMRGELENPYGDCCACCKAFKYTTDSACGKCPISLYAEVDHCNIDQYVQAENSYRWKGIDSPQFKDAAQMQIIFMNKVLKAGIKEGR